ncbi:MAG: hypothetical protein IT323_05900, partial [Anaerolineae bacterium]|nr:hypothetical protein [Anaerolineae bacterium]
MSRPSRRRSAWAALALAWLALLAGACGPSAQSTALPPRMQGVLDYGKPVTGSLAEAETRWAFTGAAGDQITVEFRDSGPDADGGSPPPLVLLGPHGDAVGRPVRGDGPAQRIALTLPESGQ